MPTIWNSVASFVKRANVPIIASTTPAQIAEGRKDPWSQAGKYALGWVYFSIVLLFITAALHLYHVWGDKIRIALSPYDPSASSPHEEYELPSAATDSSTAHFFPAKGPLPGESEKKSQKKLQSSISTVAPFNNLMAFVRWIFYRPLPVLQIWRLRIVFPSLGASAIVLAALIFVILYTFIPQPLYYSSITINSPPMAIRAGMIAVAMIPWIIALSMKANFISMLTGIGPERLNVFHRWGSYLCLLLSLIHMIPFYIQPIWEEGALMNYKIPPHIYVYGTGFAALVPLIVLCAHSLPVFREWMYELFIVIHIPVSMVFVAMLIWHCQNYLTSWHYLWATIAIWVSSYVIRLFFLNWTNPFRMSFMIGEESAVTFLPEKAIKVTIPTRMRWKPGQYVYLRMPGISFFESHPFTIASLCSDDFPSQYGEKYRDIALVFRPFGGFTRKVFLKALEYGPYKTWTAFLEGPYGGMRREMAAFDDVVFFAGGSGITAIASQLLYLIKKIRDRKAVTKSVRIIWALRNPESMEWFKEELRICRDYAPPHTVHCHFFLTGSQQGQHTHEEQPQYHHDIIQEKIYDMLHGLDQRSSTVIAQEAAGNMEREKELRRENEDAITDLPRAYMPPTPYNYQNPYQQQIPFNFGFNNPAPSPRPQPRLTALPFHKRDGWRTDYFRPDIPQILTDCSKSFGRRACVFVCGPPSMRVEVSRTVAQLQQQVMKDPAKDEIFLHAENYNI